MRFHGDTLARTAELDFAVNIRPGPRPAALTRAMAAALESCAYPDPARAHEAVARRHGCPVTEVALGNGACELIWALAKLRSWARPVVVDPTFTEIHAALPDALSVRDVGAVPEDASFVYIGNPNNPTGALTASQAVAGLARPERVVVVDESFMDFVAGETESLAACRLSGVVVLRSLTKLWGLAGARAGYLLADPALVTELEECRQPWPVNAAALAAIEWCAADRHTPRAAAAEVAHDRAALVAALPLQVVPGAAANFVLASSPPGTAPALRDRGITVRPCGDFLGLTDDHLRIAVRAPADNARLVRALREVLPC